MILRPATPQDFGFIRAIAGRPENAPYLTDEDETALSGYLSDPSARLLIWGDDAPCGFAIFCNVGDPSGVVELMRLALDTPGQGKGAVFVRALTDHAFGPLRAQRLWLDAAGENLRAQRLYARAGFALEGHLRRHHYRPAIGRVVDILIYGMLREEWLALPAQPFAPE